MRIYLPILIILSSAILFFHLGERPFLSSGEARASEIALEMMKTGNFFVPQFNEEVILTKPPLFHWILIGCYKIFQVGEFASRFPSAVSGVLIVIVTYLFGSILWNRKTGFIAALILIVSPTFFWSARCARIDAFLLFLITFSMFCFWKGYSAVDTGKKWFLLGFAFMGLGFLAKGPIALVVPLGTIFIFLFHVKKNNLLGRVPWLLGAVIFFAIVVPWYAAISFMVDEHNAKLFFVGQNKTWFSGKGELFQGYVYIGHLIFGLFPWSIAFIFALKDIWRKFSKEKDEKISFLFIWFLLVFCVFTFFGKKVSRYILPCYPAVALLAALYLSDRKNLNGIFAVFMAAVWVFIIVAANSFGLYSGRLDPELASIIHKYINLGIINAVGVFMIILGIYGAKTKNILVSVFMIIISLFMFMSYITPVEKEYLSPKPFCEMLKTEVPQDSQLIAYKSWDNTIRYYYGRHIEVMHDENLLREYISSADRVYCLMWEKIYNKLPEDIKNKIVVVKTGYRVLEEKVILVSNT